MLPTPGLFTPCMYSNHFQLGEVKIWSFVVILLVDHFIFFSMIAITFYTAKQWKYCYKYYHHVRLLFLLKMVLPHTKKLFVKLPIGFCQWQSLEEALVRFSSYTHKTIPNMT